MDVFNAMNQNNIFFSLLNDPDKKAKVLEFLMKEGVVSRNENITPNSPLRILKKDAKTNSKLESPSALGRRRALQRLESNSSTDDALEKPSTPFVPGPELPVDQVLQGVIAFCEVRSNGEDRSQTVKNVMIAMGAKVKDTLTRDVTHVVFKDGLYSIYRKAQFMKVHIVSVLWLEAVRRYKRRMPEENYKPLDINKYANNNQSAILQKIQEDFNEVIQDERLKRNSLPREGESDRFSYVTTRKKSIRKKTLFNDSLQSGRNNEYLHQLSSVISEDELNSPVQDDANNVTKKVPNLVTSTQQVSLDKTTDETHIFSANTDKSNRDTINLDHNKCTNSSEDSFKLHVTSSTEASRNSGSGVGGDGDSHIKNNKNKRKNSGYSLTTTNSNRDSVASTNSSISVDLLSTSSSLKTKNRRKTTVGLSHSRKSSVSSRRSSLDSIRGEAEKVPATTISESQQNDVPLVKKTRKIVNNLSDVLIENTEDWPQAINLSSKNGRLDLLLPKKLLPNLSTNASKKITTVGNVFKFKNKSDKQNINYKQLNVIEQNTEQRKPKIFQQKRFIIPISQPQSSSESLSVSEITTFGNRIINLSESSDSDDELSRQNFQSEESADAKQSESNVNKSEKINKKLSRLNTIDEKKNPEEYPTRKSISNRKFKTKTDGYDSLDEFDARIEEIKNRVHQACRPHQSDDEDSSIGFNNKIEEIKRRVDDDNDKIFENKTKKYSIAKTKKQLEMNNSNNDRKKQSVKKTEVKNILRKSLFSNENYHVDNDETGSDTDNENNINKNKTINGIKLKNINGKSDVDSETNVTDSGKPKKRVTRKSLFIEKKICTDSENSDAESSKKSNHFKNDITETEKRKKRVTTRKSLFVSDETNIDSEVNNIDSSIQIINNNEKSKERIARKSLFGNDEIHDIESGKQICKKANNLKNDYGVKPKKRVTRKSLFVNGEISVGINEIEKSRSSVSDIENIKNSGEKFNHINEDITKTSINNDDGNHNVKSVKLNDTSVNLNRSSVTYTTARSSLSTTVSSTKRKLNIIAVIPSECDYDNFKMPGLYTSTQCSPPNLDNQITKNISTDTNDDKINNKKQIDTPTASIQGRKSMRLLNKSISIENCDNGTNTLLERKKSIRQINKNTSSEINDEKPMTTPSISGKRKSIRSIVDKNIPSDKDDDKQVSTPVNKRRKSIRIAEKHISSDDDNEAHDGIEEIYNRRQTTSNKRKKTPSRKINESDFETPSSNTASKLNKIDKETKSSKKIKFTTTSEDEDDKIKTPVTIKKSLKTPRKTPVKKINSEASLQSKNNIVTPGKTPRKLQVNESNTSSSKRRSTLDFESRSTRKSMKLTQTPKAKVPVLSGIVCTRFHKPDVQVFQQIVKKLGKFFVENKVSKKTTHLVCNGPSRTVNLLKAITRGCWILRSEWLYKSLEAGKWLDEEDFEMTEFSPIIQKCRVEKQAFGDLFSMDIFKNCGSIFVSRTSTPHYSELEELIGLCGGQIVRIITDADVIVGEKIPRPTSKLVTYVPEHWVLDCIQFYKQMKLKNYKITTSPS